MSTIGNISVEVSGAQPPNVSIKYLGNERIRVVIDATDVQCPGPIKIKNTRTGKSWEWNIKPCP